MHLISDVNITHPIDLGDRLVPNWKMVLWVTGNIIPQHTDRLAQIMCGEYVGLRKTKCLSSDPAAPRLTHPVEEGAVHEV